MTTEGPANKVAVFVRVWFAAFVLFGTMGILWALTSPLMSVPDEPSHTIYAAAIVRGELRGTEIVRSADEGDDVNSVVSLFELPRPYAAAGELTCHAFRPSVTADCAPELPTSTEPVTAKTGAGRYPPVYYALVGWPTLLPIEAVTAIYAMRVVNALLSAALLAVGVLGAYLLGPSAWLAAGVALATTPMVMFLAGSVNPNSLEIAAAFALWWMGLALTDPARIVRGVVVAGTGAGAAVLSVSRPLSLLFPVLILATILALSATPTRLRSLARDQRVWLAGGIVAAVLAATAAWILATGALESFSGVPATGLTAGERARFSYQLRGVRYEQMIGILGWLDTPLPRSARILWSWGLLVLGVLALLVGTLRQRIVLVLLAAFTVALPVLAEIRAADEIGFAWQGRYSLPYAVGVPICCAWVVARGRRLGGTVAVIGASLLSFWAAGSHVLTYAGALRRYMVGYPAALFSFLETAAWEPALPVVPGLVGMALVAMAFPGLVVALTRSGRRTEGAGTPAGTPAGTQHAQVSGQLPPASLALGLRHKPDGPLRADEATNEQHEADDHDGSNLRGFTERTEGRQNEE
ncbi:MAG: DUF2142 domain-containing protein, partial [Actinomycetota bacterium]|nr:DUF2142 domain-containing protein [Actinomycetota bacterium]